MNQFRNLVEFPRRGISPTQFLYLHRIAQHIKMRTNNHALRGMVTHDPSIEVAKTHTSERAATVIVLKIFM
jgi:hypothetical protein